MSVHEVYMGRKPRLAALSQRVIQSCLALTLVRGSHREKKQLTKEHDIRFLYSTDHFCNSVKDGMCKIEIGSRKTRDR